MLFVIEIVPVAMFEMPTNVVTAVVVGFVLIFLLAGVIGVVDRVQTSAWRQVAIQRRRTWEARRV